MPRCDAGRQNCTQTELRLEHVARVSGLVRRHSEVNVLKSAHREYQICPTCIINEPQAELPNIYNNEFYFHYTLTTQLV